MDVNSITYGIIGAAFKVHRALGPGLLEKIYEEALAMQLRIDGYSVETQICCPVCYNGMPLASSLKLDMLVNDLVVVELKSVSCLTDLHFKQLLTYVRIADKPVGLLINFNEADLKEPIRSREI